MKRLFSKSSKSPPPAKPVTVPAVPNPIASPTHLQPKYVIPPVPHPFPYEHIAVLVTRQGLLLRPFVPGLAHPESHVQISWGAKPVVEEVPGDGEGPDADWSECVVVYGIVGLMELFSAAYLFVVSSRSEPGPLLDPAHPVYGVKGVTAIPLTEERARMAVNTLASRNTAVARPSLLPFSPADEQTDPIQAESSEVKGAESGSPRVKFSAETQTKLMTPLNKQEFSLEDDDTPPSPTESGASTPSSVMSDNTSVAKTIANRLSFWNRLSVPVLPKRGNTSESIDSETSRLTLGEEGEEALESTVKDPSQEPGDALTNILTETAPDPTSTEERHTQLEDKIIKETIREFSMGAMYFAYNFDITRSLQHKQQELVKAKKQNELLANLNVLGEDKHGSPVGDRIDVLAEPYPTLPLWRRVDRQFWWNEWLSKPFIDAGLHSYVLPIMQGYYQVASFNVPREPVGSEKGEYAPVDYILVSRRSRERAGLRYQRRGIDDEANVANFVETEAITRVEREGTQNIFSYTIIRGSIPLFWTQPGYSLKPAPVLSPERTHDQHLDAIRRHFQKLISKYGPNTIVNLAEQHGKEAVVTSAYRQYTSELNIPEVQYNDYDFHTETKGMKYENISKLIDKMERIFESHGYFWVSNDHLMSEQKGVFRVNCIDCLDRTNVVQSAFARHVLDRQLGALALLNPAEGIRTETDVVFNDVWANNGDAISRIYAGTSALKGDFTRTGKRDLGGMLNDGVNSLARMYTSTFSDWFCQAVIDYMLGYRTLSVFSEFLLKLQSSDPRDLIRLSKIRAEAIATSVSRVLLEGERLLSGWTLMSPLELNAKISRTFEEKVVLLSARALYIVSYDYSLGKVKMYTRVPLGDITKISKGAYILSPLEEASKNPLQNAGFVVTWLNNNQDTRVTSYSIRNSIETLSPPSSPITSSPGKLPSSLSSPRKGSKLSRVLSNAASDGSSATSYAAFKVLPLDPARTRRGSGNFEEPADDLTGATNCKEAVDLIVDAIERACKDVGNTHDSFVVDEDVVSLADAQKMTSVYSKMEYGIKRLLWLGAGT
ncbi:hypothetical protein GLOTRDRAFT_114553 [Gloeophyllum trabeum ATCC 11539]|uniref:SAC domain-containing protein n=1 Tax=Gloeophyllum trabeum (strain ATCC 11539 / FP-39264 / Madison 617) TaxID=670483 RepID=S7QDY8_GLOTA|nr:uncharacterized protein GLOTRDRAFT_114553 [Gloeophyllum trabeum ATCC 11539]EPQ58006.1 hypothetical protein GLOTRDRAFT_114553 [Gloeophyllum trabeum ATCC 11539]